MAGEDEECIHLLTKAFCSICNGTEAEQKQAAIAEEKRVLKLPGWIRARYSGKCGDCDEYYPVRTPICKIPKVQGWRAICCAPREEA